MNLQIDGRSGLNRKRILFLAEAVTLAHVARPAALVMALDVSKYEVFFAVSSRYDTLLGDANWTRRGLNSIGSSQFIAALAAGRPLYDVATLRDYVREDLRLIEDISPDLIVGDFRLSLSVSARKAAIPYATITNAYWSPYSVRQDFPLPVLPMTKFMPVGAARALFSLARPVAFAHHASALNRVRREHGLPSLGHDLRCVYTDADAVLYADVPELFPLSDAPASHQYLGPVLWSPSMAEPSWWNTLPTDRPIVYVTLGSSGLGEWLSGLLEALSQRPVTVLVAKAGVELPNMLGGNIFAADYLPGMEAASRAALVICNGGSPTSHQALVAGVPVLGICGNMDQFLNMQAIVDKGAGRMLRGDRLNRSVFLANVDALLADSTYSAAARVIAGIFSRYDASVRFVESVERMLGVKPTP